ncbi:MAG: hypothetical protein NTW62_02350 [Candidatus Nomurabacteria bacterium]|nr:hypothetical protein [Candidatus Nomurabacteria bacterium]
MAMDHLKQLLLLIVGLWFLWYFMIGPNKDSTKPFINPPAPLSTGDKYGPAN